MSKLEDDEVEFAEGYYLNNRMTSNITRSSSRQTETSMIEMRASPDWKDQVLSDKI